METNEQIEIEEGGKCPECDGTLEYLPVENCRCHISPPCSSCVNNPLTCNQCGWEEDPPDVGREINDQIYDPSVWISKSPSKDLGNGKRIFDYDYDSSSGSTMEYSGKYEGNVTAKDIVDFLGDGTFGHRGPILSGGRFRYTKITD